ncbi:MAG: hypothetical protein QM769_01990 [Pseudoxanthomonas sp.]
MKSLLPLLVLLAVPSAFAADLENKAQLADCVTLSPTHEGARFGSQYLLLRDGDAYYRVEFRNDYCDALNSGLVNVVTGKEHGKLCASGSKVTSKSGSCRVVAVSLIDAGKYARLSGKSRRRP